MNRPEPTGNVRVMSEAYPLREGKYPASLHNDYLLEFTPGVHKYYLALPESVVVVRVVDGKGIATINLLTRRIDELGWKQTPRLPLEHMQVFARPG